MWGEQGFSSDTQGGGYFNSNETSSPAGAKKGPKRAQSIVPVMIKHLLDGPEELQVWGTDVHFFTVVGIVRRIEPSTTKVTYEIEDETGSIVGYMWLEVDKRSSDPQIEVSSYVRVFGSLREQNQKRHIMMLRIFPITDLNELTSHLLEVTYVNLKAERLGAMGGENSMLQENSRGGENMSNSMMDSSVTGGMTPEQRMIFKIIESNESPSGTERDQIKARLPAHIVSRTDEILEFLASEGHIYTTLTDNHFRAT